MVRPLPACGAWNTIVEAPSAPSGNAAAKSAAVKIAGTRRSVPKPVAQLDDEEEIRFSTGMAEMDRVLGGGAVRGSLVLVGGAPASENPRAAANMRQYPGRKDPVCDR